MLLHNNNAAQQRLIIEKRDCISWNSLGLGHHGAQVFTFVLGPVGVVVFPDDFLFPGDFEQAATLRFGNQRIAIGQSVLGAADQAVEITVFGGAFIWPVDLVCEQVDLMHPAVPIRAVGQALVVEEQNPAIVQQVRVVLLFPDTLAIPADDVRLWVDDDKGIAIAYRN